MNRFKSGRIFILFFMALIAFYYGCAPSKKAPSEKEEKLPGTIAMSPSSFRCQAIVIECAQKEINIVVTKILEQGSSLFYSVSKGDTLTAVFQSTNNHIYPPSTPVEMHIEERIKMNSEKPEFVIKHIK